MPTIRVVLLCFLSGGGEGRWKSPIHPSSVQLMSKAGNTFPIPRPSGHKAILSTLKCDAWFPHQMISRWTYPSFPFMCLQSCLHPASRPSSSWSLSLNPTPVEEKRWGKTSWGKHHSKQAKTNTGEPRSDPRGAARWLFFCLGTQFPQRAPGSKALRVPVAAHEPQPHSHTQFQQSWETLVHPCLSGLSKTSELFICLCSSSPFCYQDSVKYGNLCSAQDKTEGRRSQHKMFAPARCLGSQALTLTCAGGVVSKVNLWTIFLEPPKRPCTSKGDLIPAPCVASMVKHFAWINYLLKKKGSPNSKHIASPWTQMWPQAHAHHMAAPPGSVESNPADTPGVPHLSTAITEPLSAVSQLRIQWGHLWEQPRAPRHPHLEGARVTSNSSLKDRPAGRPPAQCQHRMQSGAEQGVLCELLGNTPGKTPLLLGPALMGMAENSSPWKEADRGALPESHDSSASALLELIQFTTGRYGA